MPPPGLYRAQLIWQLSLVDFAVNVFHFDAEDGIPIGISEQSLADVWADAAATAFAALNVGATNSLISNDWRLDRGTIRFLGVPNRPEFTSTIGVVGSGTFAPIPAANAVCVTLRTALAGRSFRGRSYIPGWTNGAVTTTGQVATDARERAEDFVTGLRDEMLTAIPGLTMGVYSRTLDEINPVISIQVRDNQWDVQRRRNVPGI